MATHNTKILSFVAQVLQQNCVAFGDLALALTSRDLHDEVVFAHVWCLLLAEAAKEPAFARVRVVLPAGLSSFIEAAIRARVRPEHVEDVLARIEVVTTVDRSARALIAAITDVPKQSAVVCGYLEVYAPDGEHELLPATEQEGLHGERVRMFRAEHVASQVLAGLAGAVRPHLRSPDAPYVACVAACGPLGEFQALTHAVFDCVSVLTTSHSSTVTVHELEAWAAQLRDGAPIEAVRAEIVATGDDGPEVDHILALALARADQPTHAYAVFSRVLPPPGATANNAVLSAGAIHGARPRTARRAASPGGSHRSSVPLATRRHPRRPMV